MTAIQEFPGVQDAILDTETWKVEVAFESGQPDTAGLVEHFNKATDFTLTLIGEGKGQDVSLDVAGLDIETISKAGENVDLASHRAAGKITIFDFYADWCVPCKGLEAKLVELMRDDDRIALRKINIVDWESAVAKQHLEGVEGIPYVVIQADSGEELYRGTGLFDRISEVLGSRNAAGE